MAQTVAKNHQVQEAASQEPCPPPATTAPAATLDAPATDESTPDFAAGASATAPGFADLAGVPAPGVDISAIAMGTSALANFRISELDPLGSPTASTNMPGTQDLPLEILDMPGSTPPLPTRNISIDLTTSVNVDIHVSTPTGPPVAALPAVSGLSLMQVDVRPDELPDAARIGLFRR